MRAPQRRCPRRRTIYVPADANLDRLAGLVSYIGSVEHKDVPSCAGPPRLRVGDASCCPLHTNDQEMVNGWLRSAIRRGATGGLWESGFPRYAWYVSENVVFEARLVNRGNGEYKGYPLDPDEWSDGIEALYAAD